ncbi:MAG: glutamyl-tRNA reductase [Campylobacterota bacterium]|nr:glutamyl-tRNA reductase [Campylobacterota bacterium]
MNYLVVSFTHKNTDIGTREKLAFSDDVAKENFLKHVLDCNYVFEAMVLSTCNRIEITASVGVLSNAQDTIFSVLSNTSGLSKTELMSRADIHENESAVHHIFTVVSSLDSLVVGETQIAGQFKDAFRFSQDKGYSSIKLARMAQYAFKCAGAVRNATSLGTGSVSVASTAVAKAKEIFGTDSKIKALVIGAGEMSELTVKHLLRYGFEVVLISRNLKKAELLATTFDKNIEVKPYEQLKYLLNNMQLAFTATAAPYPIITKDIVEYYPQKRYWFDIALPRDIEVFKYDDLEVFAVDDLQCIVDDNMNLRAEQARTAYTIVSKMAKEFYHWLNSLGVEPLIKGMHLQGNSIIERKVSRAIKKRFIRKEDEENITKLCQTVINEMLHTSSKNLRTLSHQSDYDELTQHVRTVFDVKEIKDESSNYRCEN